MDYLALCLLYLPFSDGDMENIAAVDKTESAFFSYYDSAMVEWFVKMVKKQYDSNKEKLVTIGKVDYKLCSN